jgi:hypothetical protein
VLAATLFLANMAEWDDDTPITTPADRFQKRTPEQIAAGIKQDSGGSGIKKHFQFSFSEEVSLKRIPSSILKSGYVAGTIGGLIGPPGTGKTRFVLQEAIMAGLHDSADSFYAFNETVDTKFKYTIKRLANELGVTSDSDMKHITFWDCVRQQLATAEYLSMESIAGRIWVQNVRYWLEHECIGNPRFVIFDSFSNISRRYTPQTPIFHQYLTHQLAEMYEEMKVEPITLMIYQKSQSERELNTDSVYGGYGVNHEIDFELLLKLYKVNVWDARRYGWTEGTNVHTLAIPKDRYPEEEFMERVLKLEKGKLVLGDTVDSYVQANNGKTTSSPRFTGRQEVQGDEGEWE